MQESDILIAHELRKGERVLWRGRPDLAAVLCKGDLILVPASILWSGVALSLAIPMFLSLRDDSDMLPFVVFFAAPFAAMAIYALVGRLFLRMWIKSRTWYLLTDARVIAIRRMFGSSVHASFLDEVATVDGVGSMGGRETLWFGEVPWWMRFLGAGVLDSPTPLLGGGGPVVFYDIREAARVRELVTNPGSRS